MFVRTSGCHLRCTYCDTAYAFYEGKKISTEEILERVSSFNTKHVCITGGEPLLQPHIFDLMSTLCDRGYFVSLETSGSISCEKVDPRVKKILDVKTPDSGEADTFKMENLKWASAKDEFKFVICSEADFLWSEDFVKRHALSSDHIVFYSPSFKKVSEKWLAEKILSQKSTARLQLQLHKYIWSEVTRGV